MCASGQERRQQPAHPVSCIILCCPCPTPAWLSAIRLPCGRPASQRLASPPWAGSARRAASTSSQSRRTAGGGGSLRCGTGRGGRAGVRARRVGRPAAGLHPRPPSTWPGLAWYSCSLVPEHGTHAQPHGMRASRTARHARSAGQRQQPAAVNCSSGGVRRATAADDLADLPARLACQRETPKRPDTWPEP